MPKKMFFVPCDFASALSRYRIDRNMTAKELAKAADVKDSLIQKVEAVLPDANGNVTPCAISKPDILRLSKLFGADSLLELPDGSVAPVTRVKTESYDDSNHVSPPLFAALEGVIGEFGKKYGDFEAACVATGASYLLERCDEVLEALTCMPAKTHIGELDDESAEIIADLLPENYLMRYNYEFIWNFRASIHSAFEKLMDEESLVEYDTTLEALAICAMAHIGSDLIECALCIFHPKDVDEDAEDYCNSDWIYDFIDPEFISALFDDTRVLSIGKLSPLEFDCWTFSIQAMSVADEEFEKMMSGIFSCEDDDEDIGDDDVAICPGCPMTDP